MFGLISNMITPIAGLAGSYIEGKTAVQKAKAQTQMKIATGEIDWEAQAIKSSDNSLKDEAWTLVFILILVGNFIPQMQPIMQQGFANLATTPEWVQWGMYASIAASFGIRGMRGLSKR
mgnify:CR=1 FL=1|tara:strand:- start:213 stop:569 length:357 start_codon:yes stop_codon:yes gene_type:complete